MSGKEHTYAARLNWEGNRGQGTKQYEQYGREYRIRIEGKPDFQGSADAAFRGDPGRHNPEDHFLAAISACHMLSYLALCARAGVTVLAYEDDARGRMRLSPDGGGRFEEVTLNPQVTIERAEHSELAARLHETAHQRCFIANSCSVPIRHQAVIRASTPEGNHRAVTSTGRTGRRAGK